MTREQIVVDASVAIALVHDEPDSGAIRETLAAWIAANVELVLPGHFWLEVVNPLARRHGYDSRRLFEALRDLDELPFTTMETLRPQARTRDLLDGSPWVDRVRCGIRRPGPDDLRPPGLDRSGDAQRRWQPRPRPAARSGPPSRAASGGGTSTLRTPRRIRRRTVRHLANLARRRVVPRDASSSGDVGPLTRDGAQTRTGYRWG